MPKVDPNLLLTRVLLLIDKDVKRIKKANPTEVLDNKTAATLCQYASTIAKIKHEKDIEDAKAKKRLEQLPTEELIKKYQKQKEIK